MKRWDKEDPEEIRRRRKEKALARGEHWSDSYDDELDPDDEMTKNEIYNTLGRDGDGSTTEIIGKSGSSMMHKVNEARHRALVRGMASQGEVTLSCPEGFDPVKWAQMSRAEKMKVLGITEKEWNQMTREQQMKRMNNLAHGFHFYAMKKK